MIFLHVGLPKTGTTTLQYHAKSGAISNELVYLHDDSHFIQSRLFTNYIIDQDWQALEACVSAFLDQPKSVLISDEVICQDRVLLARNTLLSRFAQLFRPTIVVTLRPLEAWVTSLFSQKLKKDPSVSVPDLFASTLKNKKLIGFTLNIFGVLNRLKKLSDEANTELLLVCSRDDVINNFLESIDIKPDHSHDSRIKDNFNVSPRKDKLIYSRLLSMTEYCSGLPLSSSLTEQELISRLDGYHLDLISQQWMDKFMSDIVQSEDYLLASQWLSRNLLAFLMQRIDYPSSGNALYLSDLSLPLHLDVL